MVQKEVWYEADTWKLSFGDIFMLLERHGRVSDCAEDYAKVNDLYELIAEDINGYAMSCVVKSDITDLTAIALLYYSSAEDWLISHGHLDNVEKKIIVEVVKD